MNNEKNAKFYAKMIADESSHKIVYANKDNRELLIENVNNYPIKNDDNASILYMRYKGLPNINIIDKTTKKLDKSIIKLISNEYFSCQFFN